MNVYLTHARMVERVGMNWTFIDASVCLGILDPTAKPTFKSVHPIHVRMELLVLIWSMGSIAPVPLDSLAPPARPIQMNVLPTHVSTVGRAWME
jgi:hypothetical protein